MIWERASLEVIDIAERLIDNYHQRLHAVRIGFLFRESASLSKGMLVLGGAQLVPARLKPYMDYDFMIWLALEEFNHLESEQREALIDHQLCHCGVDEDDKLYLVGHNVEEFSIILNRYGFWNSSLLNVKKAFQLEMFTGLEKVEIEYIKAGRVDAVDPEKMPEGALT